MTAKEILIKVKAAFLGEVAPVIPAAAAAPVAPPVIAAVPFKLKDGTEIAIAIKDPAVTAEPSAGDAVTVAGAPAPDGELELEDGTKITVTGGAISAVTPIEPATQPDFAAPVAPTMEERIAAMEQELAALKAKPAAAPTGYATVDQFSEVSGKFEAAIKQIKKQDEVITGLFELCDELIKEPSAEPKTLSGNAKEKFDKQDAKEKRIEARAAAYSAIKNKSKNPAATV